MIKFESIKLKNFRSYKKETSVSFYKKNFNLIIGDNGAGKSSIFRALIWGIIGTDSEGIKGTNLKSWDGKGFCFVEIEFSINNKRHILYRQQSPNKLRLNDQDIDQKTIDNLFNFNTKIFSFILFMSQFSDQFIHVSSTEKLELFTQILELEKWNKYSENAKSETHKLNNKLQVLMAEKERLEGRKDFVSTLSYEKDKESFETDRQKEIVTYTNSINEITKKINNLIKEIENLEIDIVNLEKGYKEEKQIEIDNVNTVLLEKRSTLEKLKNKIVITDDITTLTNEVNNLYLKQRDNDHKVKAIQLDIENTSKQIKDIVEKFDKMGNTNCKECHQLISNTYAEKQVKQHRDSSNEKIKTLKEEMFSYNNSKIEIVLDINKKEIEIDTIREAERNNAKLQKKIDNTQKEIDGDVTKITYLNKEKEMINPEISSIVQIVNSKNNRVEYHKKEISDTNKRIETTENKLNPYIEKISNLKKDKIEIERHLKDKESQYSEIESNKINYEYWIKAFKEIKLLITEESIKEFNYFCNDNLQKLGLPDWKIENSIDKLLKSKKVKRGFNTLITNGTNEIDVPLNCFSGGEQQRLKLAMVLGLIDFLNSRININIEVYDEPTQWLNNEGITNLLDVLKERSKNKSIYLIDHRNFENNGIFDNIFQIKKTNEGSKIYDM